jgi:branched-chain amino acid transport system ATP-binding protein
LDRKRLETARALSTNPHLLLLDEIAGGLTESEAQQVLEIVRGVNRKGVSIIWIEHLMAMMEGVDRILALDQGRNLLCGEPGQVMDSEEVLACYLGADDDS